MKRLFYIVPMLALALVSCEDYYIKNQLDNEYEIEDVRNFRYTLTGDDYNTIATPASGKNASPTVYEQAALAMDSDSVAYKALLGMSKTHCFSHLVPADTYIPLFLEQKYPNLSTGTLCEVVYTEEVDAPSYYAQFDTIILHTPQGMLQDTAEIRDDLAAAYGGTALPNGTKFVVNYRSTEAYLYEYYQEKFQKYKNTSVNTVVLTKADYEAFSAQGLPDLATLSLYMAVHYPYAKAEDKYLVVHATKDGKQGAFTEVVYDGEVWKQVELRQTETLTFELEKQWEANFMTYLQEAFVGHGQGDFVIQDVLLTSPLTYVWYYNSRYGMCASAYKGTSYEAESWLVSPVIKLRRATNPSLIFDQAFNKAPNFTEEATVLVSTDYTGDVTTATWTALEWNKNEDGTLNVPEGNSWNFQTTGEMSLKEFVGQDVHIGFRYTTKEGVSGTWEIQNVLVHELTEE